MTYPVTFGGDTFNAADFVGYAYATTWERYLTALANLQTTISAAEISAVAANAAAQSALATALSITGGAQGVGADPLDVPRVAELGSAAFFSAGALRGRWPVAPGAAYQIVPEDYGKLLIADTGTLTWTLPLLSDLPPGWWVAGWNRSGANLTINRTSPDVIGNAGTSLTIADGSGFAIARRDATRFERFG